MLLVCQVFQQHNHNIVFQIISVMHIYMYISNQSCVHVWLPEGSILSSRHGCKVFMLMSNGSNYSVVELLLNAEAHRLIMGHTMLVQMQYTIVCSFAWFWTVRFSGLTDRV